MEQWKGIYFEENGVIWDYRELYQVSSEGAVKSLNYNRTGKERILKTIKNKGYLLVELCKNGKRKKFFIHRLVAHMFIYNDDQEHKTQVNHIDENPSNNSVLNLEWCTSQYNHDYGTRNKRIAKIRSQKVIGYSLTYTKVIVLQSVMQSKKFGFNSGAISSACRGKYYDTHEYKGYKWYYLDDIKNSKLSVKED